MRSSVDFDSFESHWWIGDPDINLVVVLMKIIEAIHTETLRKFRFDRHMDAAVCNDQNCPGFIADGFEYGTNSSGNVVNALSAWRRLAMPGVSPLIVCWPDFFSKVRFKTAFVVPQVDFQQCRIGFNRVSRAIENDSSGFLCAIEW